LGANFGEIAEGAGEVAILGWRRSEDTIFSLEATGGGNLVFVLAVLRFQTVRGYRHIGKCVALGGAVTGFAGAWWRMAMRRWKFRLRLSI
jgi:hypothetical protein